MRIRNTARIAFDVDPSSVVDPDPYPGIKNWLDSKSGSVSNDTIRIQQKPFKTENNFNFFTQI